VATRFKKIMSFCSEPHTYLNVLSFSACNKSTSPEQITSDNEIITSPLYPDYYPNNQTCTWLVIVPPGQIVGYKFSQLKLGKSDIVELKEGQNAGLIDIFDKDYTIKETFWATSPSGFLWVKFQSNIDFTFDGFKMKIKFFNDSKGT